MGRYSIEIPCLTDLRIVAHQSPPCSPGFFKENIKYDKRLAIHILDLSLLKRSVNVIRQYSLPSMCLENGISRGQSAGSGISDPDSLCSKQSVVL
jgi:hypothetical protein